MFGWGNRYAFPPILRAHHQTGVWLAVMLLQPNSVPPLLTPLAVIAIPPLALIRDSIPVSYFLFHFLPSSTSSSQTFPFHIASSLTGRYHHSFSMPSVIVLSRPKVLLYHDN
ncbi:hypothetical protein Godav_028638 [Gossypium davidsonii]|uniref:Uncharacterized protein n=1 Tax=Gossypium davidsonii TaxID=34287 RepID=A0A7J8S085_GOSDV|nr:hypothetical protein [Gossypium davidsonii]